MRRDVEPGRATFVDVLDRVLDKGIVIEGWGRVAVAGIDLIGIDGWVVVASIHTYLNYAESLGLSPLVPTSASAPALDVRYRSACPSGLATRNTNAIRNVSAPMTA